MEEDATMEFEDPPADTNLQEVSVPKTGEKSLLRKYYYVETIFFRLKLSLKTLANLIHHAIPLCWIWTRMKVEKIVGEQLMVRTIEMKIPTLLNRHITS